MKQIFQPHDPRDKDDTLPYVLITLALMFVAYIVGLICGAIAMIGASIFK
jgi:hypothetical protein